MYVVRKTSTKLLICTLFTGLSSKEGFFMRYSYEYKRKCVELYREGKWPDFPEGISKEAFKKTIRRWVRSEDGLGPESLHHKNRNRVWAPEEKFKLVSKVIAGESVLAVSLSAGISNSLLYGWVQKYKEKGYNGLINKRAPSLKDCIMKREIKPTPLTESEREELIRLRAEVEYMKAENEVIKKEIALREERQAAQLKAKKQQSSKNFVKKDIN